MIDFFNSYIVVVVGIFYYIALAFVTYIDVIEGKKSFRGFLNHIPNVFRMLRQIKKIGRLGHTLIVALIPMGFILLPFYGLFWIVDFVFENISVIGLILILFVVGGIYYYLEYLKRIEKYRVQTSYFVSALVERMSNKYKGLEKLSTEDIFAPVVANVSDGKKIFIYTSKVILPDHEFDLDRMRLSINRYVEAVCYQNNWYGSNGHCLFRIVNFDYREEVIVLQVACLMNEETIIEADRYEMKQRGVLKNSNVVDGKEKLVLVDEDF